MFLRDPERDTSARSATIEAEHEAGLFRRSPMHKGVDAESAMFADEPRRNLLDEFETGPPHQRAIAEHPQIAFGQFWWLGFRWHRGHCLSEFCDR